MMAVANTISAAIKSAGHRPMAETMPVQKANYAVSMYKKLGFEIVDENGEEYIMVNKL